MPRGYTTNLNYQDLCTVTTARAKSRIDTQTEEPWTAPERMCYYITS
jgi:hypothetical protein